MVYSSLIVASTLSHAVSTVNSGRRSNARHTGWPSGSPSVLPNDAHPVDRQTIKPIPNNDIKFRFHITVFQLNKLKKLCMAWIMNQRLKDIFDLFSDLFEGYSILFFKDKGRKSFAGIIYGMFPKRVFRN